MKALLFMALFALSSPLFAQTTVTSGSNSDSNASSGSSAGANNANQVGVNINSTSPDQQTINARTNGTTNFKTNTPVMLTAATSFSSDYCGGTNSGGASAGGISIGGSKVVMDPNCQALRRAEKFGMGAVTAANLGHKDQAARLMTLYAWQLCIIDPVTQDACMKLGLVVEGTLPDSQNPAPAPTN